MPLRGSCLGQSRNESVGSPASSGSNVRTTDVGDVSSKEAFAQLSSSAQSALIDVRTRAEWSFVGVPSLSSVSKEVMFLEWQSFPSGAVNDRFVDELTGLLEAKEIERTTELFFICRSGARSLAAARAMASAGYENCVNVSDGFEGPVDANGHRGRITGWKASDLPWVQS